MSSIVLICALFIAVACFCFAYFVGEFHFLFNEDFYFLTVNSRELVFETDKRFLSVALDTSFMTHAFHNLSDKQWERLEELTSFLSPGYLRVGGTQADQIVFTLDEATSDVWNSSEKNSSLDLDDVSSDGVLYITGKDWIKIYNFARNSGLYFIFDLNVLLRDSSGWNSSNAKTLLKFSEENGFVLDFQLGNEPNSFPHVFNYSLSGSLLAQDFETLRKLLDSSNTYRRSKLIGPDVTRPKHIATPSLDYLREFLSRTNSVDVVSWHQYYLNGRTATLNDFVNPKTFEILPSQIKSVVKVVREFSTNLPIWISETGSAFGGGAPGLSDKFGASFLWLDKLGLSAKLGMSVIIRQSLFKGYYALISPNILPNPDFWVSFFYKNLVGNKVISVEGSESSERSSFLRFYGHCLKPNSKVNGSLVLYGMNLSNKSELVVTRGINIYYPIYSYTLRPELNDLMTQSVFMNGMRLVYNREKMYEWFEKAQPVELPLVLPRYSIVFWIFQEIDKSVCNQS